MLDIDRFKRINDTYGHAAGDTVLQNAAVEHLDFSSIAPDLHVTISLGVHVASRYDTVAGIGWRRGQRHHSSKYGNPRLHAYRLDTQKS